MFLISGQKRCYIFTFEFEEAVGDFSSLGLALSLILLSGKIKCKRIRETLKLKLNGCTEWLMPEVKLSKGMLIDFFSLTSCDEGRINSF